MCGISVVVALKKNSYYSNSESGETLEKALDKSLDQIVHRGPDSRGQWISKDRSIGNANNLDPRSDMQLY